MTGGRAGREFLGQVSVSAFRLCAPGLTHLPKRVHVQEALDVVLLVQHVFLQRLRLWRLERLLPGIRIRARIRPRAPREMEPPIPVQIDTKTSIPCWLTVLAPETIAGGGPGVRVAVGVRDGDEGEFKCVEEGGGGGL